MTPWVKIKILKSFCASDKNSSYGQMDRGNNNIPELYLESAGIIIYIIVAYFG